MLNELQLGEFIDEQPAVTQSAISGFSAEN